MQKRFRNLVTALALPTFILQLEGTQPCSTPYQSLNYASPCREKDPVNGPRGYVLEKAG